MSDKVAYLPVWKRDATAAERFAELAQIAAKHPERFRRVVVLYQAQRPNGNVETDYVEAGCSTIEVLGLLALAPIIVERQTRTEPQA